MEVNLVFPASQGFTMQLEAILAESKSESTAFSLTSDETAIALRTSQTAMVFSDDHFSDFRVPKDRFALQETIDILPILPVLPDGTLDKGVAQHRIDEDMPFDYIMGKRFNKGAHGEVWRAVKLSCVAKKQQHDSRDHERDCDGRYESDNRRYVLKRMLIEKGAHVLQAGLREIYFGTMFMQGHPKIARYVSHFYREMELNERNEKRHTGSLLFSFVS